MNYKTIGIDGLLVGVPEGMSKEEAAGYAKHAKEKFGGHNITGIQITLNGDDVVIYCGMIARPYERIKRLSTDARRALEANMEGASGD